VREREREKTNVRRENFKKIEREREFPSPEGLLDEIKRANIKHRRTSLPNETKERERERRKRVVHAWLCSDTHTLSLLET